MIAAKNTESDSENQGHVFEEDYESTSDALNDTIDDEISDIDEGEQGTSNHHFPDITPSLHFKFNPPPPLLLSTLHNQLYLIHSNLILLK